VHKVFFAPGERFAELKERPDWLLPMALALFLPLIISAVAMVAFPRQDLVSAAEERTQRVRDFVETRLQQAGNMSDEQKTQTLQQMDERTQAEIRLLRNSGPLALFGQTLLRSLPGVAWSAGQLLLWTVILNFMMPLLGVGGGFRRCLAVTTNAALARPVASLFRGAVMLASGNVVVRTNALLVLPQNAPVFLRAFGACVDVFTLWEVGLVAFGLHTVFGPDLKKTMAAAFGVWLVYALLLGGVMSMLGMTAFL